MRFTETILKDSYLIVPDLFEDHRGFFSRWYCNHEFGERGLTTGFVQCNHSGTTGKGSIRGMHFQLPPHAEVKLVKCVAGKIFDVIIDIRQGSPTFLKWFGTELSAENKTMLYIPKGFAHGFQTLTEEAEIFYMVSSTYKKEAESGVRYNDPMIGIEWPLPLLKISEKDQQIPMLDSQSFKGIEA
jgi:dTDP-4-dehydrorhamnose 3,5-epimerase